MIKNQQKLGTEDLDFPVENVGSVQKIKSRSRRTKLCFGVVKGRGRFGSLDHGEAQRGPEVVPSEPYRQERKRTSNGWVLILTFTLFTPVRTPTHKVQTSGGPEVPPAGGLSVHSTCGRVGLGRKENSLILKFS